MIFNKIFLFSKSGIVAALRPDMNIEILIIRIAASDRCNWSTLWPT